MKKILLTMAFISMHYVCGMAQTYYVEGPNTYFTDNWDDNNKEKMEPVDFNGTQRYYLAKQFTITADATTVPFRIERKLGNGYAHGYMTYNSYVDYSGANNTATQNSPATLYFAKAGTYWVVFTIDKNNDQSLDAVLMANISQDFNNGDSPLWTEQTMEYNESDKYFHVRKEVHITTAGQQGRFKAKVYHRSTATDPVWYGTAGFSSVDDWDIYVNEFPEVGDYEIEFLLDPVKKTAPWYRNVRGYRDVTIGSYGYTTFSYHKVLDVPDDVSVYFIDGEKSKGNLSTTAATQVPKTETTPQKGTGVIIQGTAGSTHRFYWSSDESSIALTGNKLYGTGSTSYTVTADDTYCFTQKDGALGFYLAEAGDYPANKAYLKASDFGGDASARGFIGISFDADNMLSVDAMSKQPTAGTSTYYNLQGQPVEHPTKGLYIVDGRKVVVK